MYGEPLDIQDLREELARDWQWLRVGDIELVRSTHESRDVGKHEDMFVRARAEFRDKEVEILVYPDVPSMQLDFTKQHGSLQRRDFVLLSASPYSDLQNIVIVDGGELTPSTGLVEALQDLR
jgi:hypothetical protein